MKRVLLAAVLGTIGMFVWSFVAHMGLPLGELGVSEIPNEAPVLGAMQSSMGDQAGLYIFPGMGIGAHPTRAQRSEAMSHYQEKLDANPSGLLIYHPPGAKGTIGGHLVTEFVTEFLEAFLASLLLAWATLGTYSRRVAFVLTIGFVAAITTNVPYWNWYGFPSIYTLGYVFSQLIAFLVLGLIAGKVLKTV